MDQRNLGHLARPALPHGAIRPWRGSGHQLGAIAGHMDRRNRQTNARHVARCCGLHLSGSLGLLLRAQRHGAKLLMTGAIQRMRTPGVWISDSLAHEAIRPSIR
jgi:hypothetical protein